MNPVAITPGTVVTSIDQLDGWSIQEDAAGVAIVEIRKATVTGQVVAYLTLAAGESANLVYPKSVSCEGGVYLKEVSGSITGVFLGS